MQIDEPAIPKHCLKILVIQDCPGLENAIWNVSDLVELLTDYYRPQFKEMSIDYKPLQIDPMSVCGQYVAIIIDFACLPEIELEQKRAISELGVMLNPNCPEPLILISGVDYRKKTKLKMLELIVVDHFRLTFEMVENILIVYCVSVRGTMYTEGPRAEIEMPEDQYQDVYSCTI